MSLPRGPVRITYFVHGATVDNEKGLATGWAPGKLSEKGIAQSRELAASLAGERFDAVFCSDLRRAVDSAQLVFGGRHRIMRDRRLREVDYGDWTGKPAWEFKERMADFVEKPFPGGESYRDVERRMGEFLASIREKYAGKRVALVAHQAPQLALDVLLRGKSWQTAITEDWRKRNAWQPGWHYTLEG